MKTRRTMLLIAMLLSLACDEEQDKATVLFESGCVTTNALIHDDDTYDEELILEWDPGGTLEIAHRHACHNCAFKLGSVTYELANGVLRITEHSGDSEAAACWCLFVLEYEIDDLDNGVYEIEVRSEWQGNTSLHFAEEVTLPATESAAFEFAEYVEAGCG